MGYEKHTEWPDGARWFTYGLRVCAEAGKRPGSLADICGYVLKKSDVGLFGNFVHSIGVVGGC